MDIKSILGYSKNSPYVNEDYLDINTPEGLIDMSNTPMDLIGIDNLGNKKKMKAGRKNPYKFAGTVVREIPLQKGGFSTGKDIFNFLFEDDKEDENIPTAPAQDEVSNQTEHPDTPSFQADDEELLATQLAMEGNPYQQRRMSVTDDGNPYKHNSYVDDLGSYGESYKNIDSNVAKATNELLAKFPNLKLTSGRRDWGDKDAHPVGRAVDLSYDEEAFKYYETVLVPKYGFNKALNPNHGTGKHIHLGYY